MNEVEQLTATKKRTWLGLRLVIYALPVGIAAAFFFGFNTIGQWDVSTGRSRTVTTLLGIPISHGEPEATALSLWLGEKLGEERWVTVRGPAPKAKGVRVSWCSHKLLDRLRNMEFELGFADDMGWLRGNEGQTFIARKILHSLSKGEAICDIYSQVGRFKEELSATASSLKPITLNTLVTLWRESEKPR